MGLSTVEKEKIEKTLKTCLRNKFSKYKPETTIMPFHTRLLGKDRMALFSFIQSLNTTFGTTIYEPVAKALAETKFKTAKTQVDVGKRISMKAQMVIQDIIDDLRSAKIQPDKEYEIKLIREVCNSGEMKQVTLTKVDFFIENNQNEVFLYDLKTAKPNIGDFQKYKQTLLEWIAVYLAEKPDRKINSLIAIPYNPYEPEPYARWTLRGMLDLKYELQVAEDFWDFIGGKSAYSDLLDCFERVGIELRPEIDEYFRKFNK